jgi:hypothetical protein
MADSFILCSHQAFKTHIKSIVVFIHKDDRMEVAQGQFADKEGGGGDLTCLESRMSFLQVRASMLMKEKLRQVWSATCVNWREITHIRLEASLQLTVRYHSGGSMKLNTCNLLLPHIVFFIT